MIFIDIILLIEMYLYLYLIFDINIKYINFYFFVNNYFGDGI